MAARKLNVARRGFGIPRVSKVNGREGESFRSPDNQWSDILATAKRHGIVMANRDDDIDVSGTTMQRRALRRGIDAIRDGEADVLVFAKLDRYSRSTLGGLQTLEEVEALGGSLYFGDIDVDTRTPTGRQIFTIMLSNAEREVAEKALEMARNARQATLDGVAISAPLPGYRRTKDRRIEPDPKLAPLIRPLFEMRAAGKSWSHIRRWWHGKTGEWVKLGRFRKMIESRLYLGELRYGDTLSDRRHTPLVTPRLWEDAQTVTAARPPRSSESTALLAGVLVCSGCMRPMTPSGGHGGTMYRCQSRNATSWTCAEPVSIMQARVDAWVVERFLEWSRVELRAMVTTGDLEDEFARVDARIADAEEELAAYLDATSARSPRFAAGAAKREAAVEEAVAERKRLESERVVAGIRYQANERWDEWDIDERRQMLRACIERVVVQPTRLTSAGGRARLPVADRVGIDWASD